MTQARRSLYGRGIPALALLVCLWLVVPVAAQPAASATAATASSELAAASQPAGAAPDHGAHGSGGAASEAEHHEESLFSFLSRIANFLVLAGGLYYLLRRPLGEYLASRAVQIKADLVEADTTRQTATAELRDIDARMKALPAEVEAMAAQGRREVEAEQQRIRVAAATERERLLEQVRREVDQQWQAARRGLKQEVADLVIGIARLRISHEITDQDRARLLDRYVAQVKTAHE